MDEDTKKLLVAFLLILFTFVTFGLVVLIFAPHITRVPLQANHVMRTKKIGKPSVSRANAFAVYSVTIWNETSGKTTTRLDKLNIGTGTVAEKYTKPIEGVKDFSPSFSSDSTLIAFLSTRTGNAQIFTIPTGGTEKHVKQITNFPVPLRSLRWAPNNKYMLFTAEVYEDCSDQEDVLECTAKRDAQLAQQPNNLYSFSQLNVFRGSNIAVPNKHVHLFMLPIERSFEFRVTGKPVDLMRNSSASLPSIHNSPLGNIAHTDFEESYHYDIVETNDQIVFVSLDMSRDFAWNTSYQLSTVSIGDNLNPSAPIIIYSTRKRPILRPRYSPDTKMIAFLVQRSIQTPNQNALLIFDRKEQKITPFASEISLISLEWFPYSDGFLVEADYDGMHSLLTMSYPSGTIVASVYEGTTTDPVFIPNTWYILAKRHSFSKTPNFWRFETLMGGVAFYFMRLTNYDDATLETVDMPPVPEEFYFSGSLGRKIQGWLMRPPNVEASPPGTTFPIVVLLHDSGASWISRWNFNLNPLVFASEGFAVVAINYDGSSGYNRKMNMTNTISTVPVEDLELGLDYILSQNKWMDRHRICILGMSTWLTNYLHATQTNFSCVINYAGIFDMTDQNFLDRFNDVDNWGNSQQMEILNARNHVQNMSTPTLLVHGARDSIVPVTESLALFSALQRRNVPSKLLVFPNEGHWIEDSSNLKQFYEETLAWLKYWTRSNKKTREENRKQHSSEL